MTRSARADVRNPILRLPAARRLAAALEAMPPEVGDTFRALLREIAADAGARADHLWSRRKPPMAAYWRAQAVNARHIALALRPVVARARQRRTPEAAHA